MPAAALLVSLPGEKSPNIDVQLPCKQIFTLNI